MLNFSVVNFKALFSRSLVYHYIPYVLKFLFLFSLSSAFSVLFSVFSILSLFFVYSMSSIALLALFPIFSNNYFCPLFSRSILHIFHQCFHSYQHLFLFWLLSVCCYFAFILSSVLLSCSRCCLFWLVSRCLLFQFSWSWFFICSLFSVFSKLVSPSISICPILSILTSILSVRYLIFLLSRTFYFLNSSLYSVISLSTTFNSQFTVSFFLFYHPIPFPLSA